MKQLDFFKEKNKHERSSFFFAGERSIRQLLGAVFRSFTFRKRKEMSKYEDDMELSQKFSLGIFLLFYFFISLFISSSVFVNGKSKFCKHDNNSSGTPVYISLDFPFLSFPPPSDSLFARTFTSSTFDTVYYNLLKDYLTKNEVSKILLLTFLYSFEPVNRRVARSKRPPWKLFRVSLYLMRSSSFSSLNLAVSIYNIQRDRTKKRT